MVVITKEEMMVIKKMFPDVHIRRTTSKRYMEEDKRALSYLKSIREGVKH